MRVFSALVVLFWGSHLYAGCDIPSHMDVESFTFTFEDNEGVTRDTTITLPDYKEVDCKVVGDWGPNYYFQAKQTYGFLYETSEGETLESELNHRLTAHSTMIAAQRAKWPHYIVMHDLKHWLKYTVKFHKDRGPDVVEVWQWSDTNWGWIGKVKVTDRTFREE